MQRQQLEARKEAFKIYNKYFEFIKHAAEKNNAPDDVMEMIATAQLRLADAKHHGMTVEEYLKSARQMPAFIPKEYLLPPFPVDISMTDFKNLLDAYELQQYESSEVFRNVINFLTQEENDDRFIQYYEIARDHSIFPKEDARNFNTRFELIRRILDEAADWVKTANNMAKFYNRLPLKLLSDCRRSITSKRAELQKLPIEERARFFDKAYKLISSKYPDMSQVKSDDKMLMNLFIRSLRAIIVLNKTIKELRAFEEALPLNGESLRDSLRIAYEAYEEKKSRTFELILLYHDESKVMEVLQKYYAKSELKNIKDTFKNEYISAMIEEVLAKMKKDKATPASESASAMFPAKPAEKKPKKHKEEVTGKAKEESKDASRKSATKKKP